MTGASRENLTAIAADAQSVADQSLLRFAGRRVRMRVECEGAQIEYVGRVPRASEMRQWLAGQTFGAACVLARPGSHDPANPISPQVHYLRVRDGEWCMVRMRLQDAEPLEIRRVGRSVSVQVESLE